jgi:hypothetical protein
LLLSLVLVSSGSEAKPFPLHAGPPPKDWQENKINEGLPYRWEKGTVYVLAWEEIEEKSAHRIWRRRQVLILKGFDEPTRMGRHRWVLAHLYHHPEDKDRPWSRGMLHIWPPPPGEKMPKLTDAKVFGHEFYKDLPTDKQIATFLSEAGWTPRLGPDKAFTISDGKKVTIKSMTTLSAGGVDRALWKRLFGRDVPTSLFPELRKASK